MCTEAKLQNKKPHICGRPCFTQHGIFCNITAGNNPFSLAVGDMTQHPLAHCEFPGQWLALTQYVLIPGCNIMPFCWMPPVSPYSHWKYWQPRHTCPIFKTLFGGLRELCEPGDSGLYLTGTLVFFIVFHFDFTQWSVSFSFHSE